MPGTRKRKISAATEGELKFRLLEILENSEIGLNLDEIKMQDPLLLNGYTTQRLSRILGSLIEYGLVKKGLSKSTGRMKYMTVSKMRQQGFEIQEESPSEPEKEYRGIEWDFEEEIGGLIE